MLCWVWRSCSSERFSAERFDLKDVGLSGMVFITCTNIWPPIVLFFFALSPSGTATLPSRLHGYEVFIALAAFVSLLTSILTIAGAFVEAANTRR